MERSKENIREQALQCKEGYKASEDNSPEPRSCRNVSRHGEMRWLGGPGESPAHESSSTTIPVDNKKDGSLVRGSPQKTMAYLHGIVLYARVVSAL
jgi:hypothetical protein